MEIKNHDPNNVFIIIPISSVYILNYALALLQKIRHYKLLTYTIANEW